MKLTVIEDQGEKFYMSDVQASAIEALLETNGGGFATVHGYVSTSGRVKPETADITFISRFSTERLYQRRLKALEAMTMDDIMADIKADPKLSKLSNPDLVGIFHDRRNMLMDSIKTTQAGDRSDAHRQAHDRCYHVFGNGVKVHFQTEKDDAGIKQPVLLNGLPIVESIMLSAIEVGRKVTEPGEYKVVNSGNPVRMGNIIERHLPRSTKFRSFSLKEGNFTSLSLAGKEYLAEEFEGIQL